MYLLDANVFIQAKNTYYAFDVCPGFWDSLIGAFERGQVRTVAPVRAELEVGKDELADWVHAQVPKAFFFPVDEAAVLAQYRLVSGHVAGSTQFFEPAKADFLSGADAWLVAYSVVHKLTLVTQEQIRVEARNRIPLPNVAQAFGVPFVNTFEMLRDLRIQYTWQAKQMEY